MMEIGMSRPFKNMKKRKKFKYGGINYYTIDIDMTY